MQLILQLHWQDAGLKKLLKHPSRRCIDFTLSQFYSAKRNECCRKKTATSDTKKPRMVEKMLQAELQPREQKTYFSSPPDHFLCTQIIVINRPQCSRTQRKLVCGAVNLMKLTGLLTNMYFSIHTISDLYWCISSCASLWVYTIVQPHLLFKRGLQCRHTLGISIYTVICRISTWAWSTLWEIDLPHSGCLTLASINPKQQTAVELWAAPWVFHTADGGCRLCGRCSVGACLTPNNALSRINSLWPAEIKHGLWSDSSSEWVQGVKVVLSGETR